MFSITDFLQLAAQLGTALAGFAGIAMSLMEFRLIDAPMIRRLKWLLYNGLGVTGLSLMSLTLLAIGRPSAEVWTTSSGIHLAVLVVGIPLVTLEMWRDAESSSMGTIALRSLKDPAELAGWVVALVLIGLQASNLFLETASPIPYAICLALMLGLAGFHFFGVFAALLRKKGGG